MELKGNKTTGTEMSMRRNKSQGRKFEACCDFPPHENLSK